MAKGYVYLQVLPEFGGSGKVIGMKVVGMTQGIPNSPQSGTLVVRVDMEIPDDRLLPYLIRALPDDLRMKADYDATMANLGKS